MSSVINIKPKGDKSTAKIVTVVIVAIVMLIVVFNCFSIVKAGHTGVVVTLGKVSDSVLQTISSKVAINYRVTQTASASIYKNVGVDFTNVIVNPAIQECVKSVTAKYTAEELITDRAIISTQMEESISDKINPYGLNIEVFNIINFDFSEEFNKAIEAKQTAQQEALKAEQDLARIKIEAQQTIERATAEAEAYRLKNQELTDSVIKMEFIDKWDGKLPSVVSDAGTMFDVGSLLGIDESKTDKDTNAKSANE